jgi:histidyl-tRNA synthetase
MPTDAELLEIAGMRPDVFVIASENEEAQAKLGSVVAQLRRGDLVDTGQRPVPRDGVAGAKGLHVRRSYKSTKKIGKLLQEAADVRAKFAVILESGTEATVKNLVTGEQDQSRTPIDQLGEVLRKRL